MGDFLFDYMPFIFMTVINTSAICIFLGMFLFRRHLLIELNSAGLYPTTKSYVFFFITLYECALIKIKLAKSGEKLPRYLNIVIFLLTVPSIALPSFVLLVLFFF